MAVVCFNQEIARGIYRMTISGAPLGRAGQFFMLRIPGTPDLLLGRPISIYESDAETEETTFVYQPVGHGTALFSSLLPGQTIDAQGPYGNGFPLEPGRAVVIGGGVGTAPLHQLVKELRAADLRKQIDVFLGFREEAYCVADFERFANSVSVNIGGIVTDDVVFSENIVYYACGLPPMLRAASRAAEISNARLYVSLEKHMACGVGACLGCTCETQNGRKRVCKDGPVFNYREVRHVL